MSVLINTGRILNFGLWILKAPKYHNERLNLSLRRLILAYNEFSPIRQRWYFTAGLSLQSIVFSQYLFSVRTLEPKRKQFSVKISTNICFINSIFFCVCDILFNQIHIWAMYKKRKISHIDPNYKAPSIFRKACISRPPARSRRLFIIK